MPPARVTRHLLCNNAGVRGGLTARESTLGDWRRILGLNPCGTYTVFLVWHGMKQSS